MARRRSRAERASSSASSCLAASSSAQPEADTGEEDGLRLAELEGELIAVAQHRNASLEVRAAGQVQAERGERPRLSRPAHHRPRDGERGLGECHRLAEPAADHERVSQVGNHRRALVGRRIDRDQRGGALHGGDPRLPVARLVEVPGQAVVEDADAHRLAHGIGLGQRRADEVDRAPRVARLRRGLRRLLEDHGAIDAGRKRIAARPWPRAPGCAPGTPGPPDRRTLRRRRAPAPSVAGSARSRSWARSQWWASWAAMPARSRGSPRA